MTNYEIQRADVATNFNIDKANKDQLRARVEALEAKLGMNLAVANLWPATNGQLIEELHARLAKDHLLQRKGVER